MQIINNFIQERIIWKTPERALGIYKHTPRFLIDRLRMHNFHRTLKLVEDRSIFYSKKFNQHRVDLKKIQTPQDLLGVYTEPKDLIQGPSGHFLCNRPDTAFETTGTTHSRPKRIFFSYREMRDIGRASAAGLWQLGVRPDDRVASAFDYSFWVSGPILKSALEIIEAFHVEAGRIDPKDFYDRIKQYEANILVGDPAWMVRLSEVAEKKGPWPIKLIFIGGENLTEVSREYIEKVWDAPVVLSYGQTEAFGSIGFECHEKNGYHINDLDLWPEIIGDDNGYGELIYTTLRRSVMPLIRYRSGDITKLVDEPCPCGMTSPRLMKLKGRVDDMVVTGVGNLTPWMFENLIEHYNTPVDVWQLAVKRNEIKDLIEFRMETNNPERMNGIQNDFLILMKDHLPTVYSGVCQGLADFEVKVFRRGELLKGRKIKRVVDERNFDYTSEKPPSAKSV